MNTISRKTTPSLKMTWPMPESIWVFDTVTLSNFLFSDSVTLLEKRYGKRGIITWEVHGELVSGIPFYKDLRKIDQLIEPHIFKLVALSKFEHKRYMELTRYLGKGEASCIAFAEGQSANVVTDDRAARSQCLKMNIPTTGTIGILKASVLDGSIDLKAADDILAKMISAGFYSPVQKISGIL